MNRLFKAGALALATLCTLALVAVITSPGTADAAKPTTGDYTAYEGVRYFASDVSIDGTLTAAGLDCTATRSWTGGTINLNASSNFAVNVGTGTTTGTVTLGGTGTQSIAIGNGAGIKTVALGSATTTSSTTISAGTGDLVLTSVDDVTLNGGSAGSLINIGTNVDGNVFHIGDDDTAADTITIGSAKDTVSVAGIAVTVGSTGTTSATVVRSGTGGVSITSGVGAVTVDLNGSRVTMPAAQTIGAGGTVAADACGGMKMISSAGGVTTDTTDSITAPAAGNAGCCMRIVNVGANSITLDNNAHFASAGAADVVLGATDAADVCSSGALGKWYQTGASNN